MKKVIFLYRDGTLIYEPKNDKHVDDYSTADNELINNKGKIFIGI